MMKSNACLGCRTYFEEGQKLPLEGMFIEFKNYFLPIKESKQKWILLKTITGFLNSKGGTIFIGVQDSQGQVSGNQLSRKQQDEFLLFLKLIIQSIKPDVDLVNRQEVTVMYVPVVTNKVFRGKYIIKIVVKQGDPSRTYHFSQKLQLEFKGKSQIFQIFHGFYRHNMGGIVQIKGEALLQEIARKASHPNEVSLTFHKFCNPEPLKLGNPITKIGFSGIRREQLRLNLSTIFHDKLQNMDVQYALTYDIENKVLLIQLQNQIQFRLINKFIKQNLKVLNQDASFKFIEKGQYLDFYLYKNNVAHYDVQNKQIDSRRQASTITTQYSESKSQSKQKSQEKDAVTNNSNNSLSSSQIWQFTSGEEQQKGQSTSQKALQLQKNSEQNQQRQKVLQKQFILTITHINIQKRQQLQPLLKNLLETIPNVTISKYIRTVQFSFDSKQDILLYNTILQKNNQKLSQHGVHNNLVFGINMKRLRISNYDEHKKKELMIYVQTKMASDIEKAQFKKSNNKFFLQCKFRTRQLTCSWLDCILSDVAMKQFMISGWQEGKAHKLKAYIHCICN